MTDQNENAGERLWEDEWGNRWRKICNDLKHIEEWVELETELQENRLNPIGQRTDDTSEDGVIFKLTIDEANREYIITSGDGKIITKGILPEDYLDIKYKDELNEISDNKLEEMLNNKNKSKKWTL